MGLACSLPMVLGRNSCQGGIGQTGRKSNRESEWIHLGSLRTPPWGQDHPAWDPQRPTGLGTAPPPRAALWDTSTSSVSSRLPINEGPSVLCRRRQCTPLQFSCLENPMDGGAWWAAVHGIAKGRTQLSDFTFTFTHWRRQWQPTPVFLPGESQGRGSLVGCRLWGRRESDTTEAT